MKKALYIVTILFSVLMFLFVFDWYVDENYQHSIGLRLEEKDDRLYTFPNYFMVQNKQEKTDVIKALTTLAKENDVELLTDRVYTNEKWIEVKDVYYYSAQNRLFNHVFFEENKKQIDFTSNESSYYTNELADTKAWNHMSYISKPYENDNRKPVIRYMPFLQYNDVDDLSLGIQFLCYEPELIIQKMKESVVLSKYIDQEKIQITSVKEFDEINADHSNQFQILLIMTGIMLLGVCIGFVFKQKRRISIEKLFGTPSARIVKRICAKTFIINVLLFCCIQLFLFTIFCTGVREVTRPIVYALCSSAVLLIAIYMLVAVLCFFSIRNLNFLKSLKNKSTNTNFHVANMVLKGCMLILVATSMITLTPKIVQGASVLYHYRQRDNFINQYYQFYEYSFNSDEQRDAIEVLYQRAEEKGALLEYCILPDDKIENDSNFFQASAMITNTNYTKLYTFIDEHKQVIDTQKLRGKEIAIIPSSMKDKLDLFYGYPLPEEKLFYENHVRCYADNYPTQAMYIDDPIIILPSVVTSDMISSNTFLIPKESAQSIQKDIDEIGKGVTMSFADLSLIVDSNMKAIRSDFIQTVLIYIVYLFSFLCVIRQDLIIYLSDKGQRTAIRYLYGEPFLKRNAAYLISNIALYGVLMILLIGMLKIEIMSAIYYSVFFYVFETIISIVYLRKTQKNMILQSLKGGEWE